MSYKSGFVTIVGRPNVGKSTLINKIIGEKIAIMSNKPQTTRNKIQCVYTEDDFQIVFLDTPGIHKPKNKLGKYMTNVAWDALKEVDVIIFMTDEDSSVGKGDDYIINQLAHINTPKVLVLNKIDRLKKDKIVDIVKQFEAYNVFDNIVPISSLNGKNINNLIEVLKEIIPEGPQYFPKDMITDQPERLIIGEIIREKALHYLDQEIPHGIAVDINKIEKRKDGEIIDILATIYCERDSHKGIIIGKNGRKLKGIGKSARIDIERLLGSKIYLDLWVKVSKNWRDKENIVKRMGYK
ncbi:GTPase Era [Clostridiisalibacter paucivorans]|uniref:GTPase Era n=1 Tax=Clostridiisalibacter paucivorans TaxID=408753 RepID=UPI00047A9EEB|nr:GTPase Era [Clostridiisalibacter paucivorans]